MAAINCVRLLYKLAVGLQILKRRASRSRGHDLQVLFETLELKFGALASLHFSQTD